VNCPRIPERLTFEEMRRARQELAAREPHNAHDFTYLRIAALAEHARDHGYEEEIAHRAFEVFITARNQVDLYPDVRPGLQRLRRRFPLASLSNGNADLGSIGLSGWFAVSLNARGIGAAKPARRCFEELARALRLDAAQVVYVGDDPLLDVAGARAAGMLTAWMNRSGLPWPAGLPRADLEVADCLSLDRLLA
jgi:FMN hydrolase / 5-amino-6-(5-phospho-D-ribitylamino)uracil phosphatase